jgi:hypothetical protein
MGLGQQRRCQAIFYKKENTKDEYEYATTWTTKTEDKEVGSGEVGTSFHTDDESIRFDTVDSLALFKPHRWTLLYT